MGRELKRVALDFNWPLNQVWRGFLNPHYKNHKDCPSCGGSGYSAEANRLKDEWYGYVHFEPSMTGSIPFTPTDEAVHRFAIRNVENGEEFYSRYFGEGISRDDVILCEALRLCGLFNTHWSHHLDDNDVAALIKADRLWDFTRRPLNDEHVRIIKDKIAAGENSWLPFDNGYVPSAREVNEWSLAGFGHDSINQWVCVRAKAERLGYSVQCLACRGHGEVWTRKDGSIRRSRRYQSHRAAVANGWKEIQPPHGPGYQLWETVSEGSPISPVFQKPSEFEDYLVGEGYSRKAARAFIGAGWAMSFMSGPSGLKRDIQMCEEFSEQAV